MLGWILQVTLNWLIWTACICSTDVTQLHINWEPSAREVEQKVDFWANKHFVRPFTVADIHKERLESRSFMKVGWGTWWWLWRLVLIGLILWLQALTWPVLTPVTYFHQEHRPVADDEDHVVAVVVDRFQQRTLRCCWWWPFCCALCLTYFGHMLTTNCWLEGLIGRRRKGVKMSSLDAVGSAASFLLLTRLNYFFRPTFPPRALWS